MNKNIPKKCWWCGQAADSREHIFKKSLIKKVYGNKEIKSIMDYNGKRKHIQGPSQDELKFKANLCKNCNNSRSAKFDKSYDKFLDYIDGKLDDLVKSKIIDWKEAYGTNWKIERTNLIKYFAKHVGCRLNHDNIELSSNITKFLDNKEDLTDLKIILEIRPFNQILTELSEQDLGIKFKTLRVGRLHGIELNGKPSIYFSWLTTGWFTMNYIYGTNIRKNKNESSLESLLMPSSIPTINPKGQTYEQIQDILEVYDKSISESITQEYFKRINEKQCM